MSEFQVMEMWLRERNKQLADVFAEKIEEWQHPCGLVAKRQFPQRYLPDGTINPHYGFTKGEHAKTWTLGAKVQVPPSSSSANSNAGEHLSNKWSAEKVKFTCHRNGEPS